jgi:hypothetical protein
MSNDPVLDAARKKFKDRISEQSESLRLKHGPKAPEYMMLALAMADAVLSSTVLGRDLAVLAMSHSMQQVAEMYSEHLFTCVLNAMAAGDSLCPQEQQVQDREEFLKSVKTNTFDLMRERMKMGA